MKIPVRSRYGVRALFDLAYHAAGGSAQIREIARRQQVPIRYLEQVMLKLKKEGLVVARRGRNGGYVLARDASSVTLGDVLRATSGTLELPAREAGQFPGAVWAELQERVNSAFDAVTLQDLCRRGDELGLPRSSGRAAPMYFI